MCVQCFATDFEVDYPRRMYFLQLNDMLYDFAAVCDTAAFHAFVTSRWAMIDAVVGLGTPFCSRGRMKGIQAAPGEIIRFVSNLLIYASAAEPECRFIIVQLGWK